MKKGILFLFIVILIPHFVRSQDPEFSSGTASLLNINPAFTGTTLSGRAEMAYRLQWPNIASTYQTYMMSYDQFFNGFGVGFNYMYDNEGRGLLQTNRDEFDLSYSIKCRKDGAGKARFVIQPGIAVAYFNRVIDFSKMLESSMINPYNLGMSITEGSGRVHMTGIDFSAGLLVYSKAICAGFSAYHLTEPNVGIMGPSPLPMRFVLHASYVLNVGSNFQLIPSVVSIKQQDFQSLKLNVDAHYRNYSFGFGYRNLEAFIFSAGYCWKKFNLRYSYDLTTNQAYLAGYTGGAHEAHFLYTFGSDKWMDKQPDLRSLY